MKLYLKDDKKDVFLKSILWNTIIDIFKDEKGIDITDNLISIKIKGFTITIKTNKPIVSLELSFLDDIIKQSFIKKISNNEIGDFEIKYI